MGLDEFKTHLQNLKVVVDQLEGRDIDMAPQATMMHDFEGSRLEHHKRRYFMTIELLKKDITSLPGLEANQVVQLVNEVNLLDNIPLDQARLRIHNIAGIVAEAKEPEKHQERIIIPHKLPSEIKNEVIADIHEIHTCFDAGAYRAVVILCGRLLETSLHWKYYNETGIDLLETSPGIGLGSIIAKLRDKNITFDPGLTQQIHLVNQVRIFSVHTKKETFNPSQRQSEAIMLYTIDILEKLVK